MARVGCQNVNIFTSRVYETNSFLGGLLVRIKILGACYVKLKVIRCVCMVFGSFVYIENDLVIFLCMHDFIRVYKVSKQVNLMHVQ